MSQPAPALPVLARPDAGEVAALRDSVRGACARLWPDATSAASGDLGALWQLAARHDWTSFGDPALFDAAMAVQQELGRLACPLPIVDVALAAGVLQARGDAGVVAHIEAGRVRPVIAHAPLAGSTTGGVLARHVEASLGATHLLVVDPAQGSLAWFDLAGADVAELPGLPIPHWSSVSPAGAPEWTLPLGEHPNLLLLRRLGLAARAAAAVARTHALALEHAKHRRQFGRTVGSFQAVSHRLVNAEIALTAARELLDHALELRAVGDAEWELAAEVYLEFVTDRLAALQFDGHHTLAAVGYFEEHEAPWLFRRAHADLAALAVISRRAGVGEHLVDQRAQLPGFARGRSAEGIRNEVLDAFAPWMDGPPSHLGTWDDKARDVMRERGWIGVGWPREVGGGGWPVADVVAFSEALAYAGPPLGNILLGINSIAPMVIKVGSPELRDLVLDRVRAGDLSIALGYSEPEVGSDLASLRTRAERVDGGWLIQGQKMWGTCFPDSQWVVLAARTDPDAPRHAGISLFLVDTDSPGIGVSPHTSLAGNVSATTYWDDVFVPDERLIGEVDAGWTALAEALAAERVQIGSTVMRAHRSFDRLVELVAGDPEVVPSGRRADLRREIGRIAVRLQAARALVNKAVRMTTTGRGTGTEASMAKIAATELTEDLNATAVALLGPDALYEWGVEGAVGNGHFEDGLRGSIMGVIAGGTGDIQRNIVARGMGLPR
jgi:alkylation response protein AidB-like acyl-CoA dehydrogenase